MLEKLAKLLCDAHSISAEAACFEDATYAKQLRMEANHLIANGVTIPVRCKDCKHKGWIQEPCHGKSVDYCRVLDFCINNADKCFCSYGERRNDV